MTEPVSDDEMRTFVRRLFNRGDDVGDDVAPADAFRTFTRQLFNRDDPDDKG